MIKERRFLFVSALHLFELLLVAASFYCAFAIRSILPFEFLKEFSQDLHDVIWLLPVALAIWSTLLWGYGLYGNFRTRTVATELWQLIKVVVTGTLLLFAVSFMLQSFGVSRAFISIFSIANLLLLIVHRMIARSFFQHYVKRGYDRVYVLIAGTGKMARRHVELIRGHAEWGLEVVGVVAESPGLTIGDVEGIEIVGTVRDIPSIVQKRVVDEVHFAVTRKTLGEIEEVVRACDEIGVRVRIVLNYFTGLSSSLHMEHLANVPLLTFSPSPHNVYKLFVKRLLDVACSFFALIALSPFFLVAALAIKLTSKGPVIFRQERVGMSGRIFKLYKFRTMVANAEHLKDQLKHLNEMDGPVFKIKNDPRITKVGRVLRKLSVDEFPQLWNVLRGDMSFVGPRPPLPSEVKEYERWQRRRLSMRPGLTSLWQIRGRNEVNFQKWMELDMEYIDTWSLLLDCWIVLRTIPVVFIGRGAS